MKTPLLLHQIIDRCDKDFAIWTFKLISIEIFVILKMQWIVEETTVLLKTVPSFFKELICVDAKEISVILKIMWIHNNRYDQYADVY